MKKLLAVVLALPLLALASWGGAEGPVAGDLASGGDALKGKVVYERYCLSCHGEVGNGAGDKIQSTRSGSAPSYSSRRSRVTVTPLCSSSR